MEILIASNNKGKLKELQSILTSFTLKTLEDKNIHIEVEENQQTYEGNSLKKAKEIYNISKMPTIADDSGLNIESLNNFPGVETHRFAGLHSTDEDRNNILLKKLENKDNRRASFTSVITYYDGKNTILGIGKLEGIIAKYPRGKNGFGFDSIFEYNGKTLAELTQEEKNKISARKLAIINLENNLKKAGIL